jgi:hypothetical protein
MTNLLHDRAGRGLGRTLGPVLLGLAAGCLSAPPPPVATLPPAAAPAPSPPPAPLAASYPKDSTPVYRNPKIAVVYLRAHQDADGRLLGPQIMYQVAEPGGWNVEAVDQGKAYIPAVNLEIPPGQGSPYVVPAREIPAPPARAALLDPDLARRVVLTGLMRREDQPQAEAIARQTGPACTAAFDPEAGWIVLPGKSPEPEAPASAAAPGSSDEPPPADRNEP